MKIAVFDVSHWHFPLYIPALNDPEIEVIGITDTSAFAGARVADLLKCKLYASNDDLLAEDFDYALVCSRHSDMAGVAERLIARGIPFFIEKPCGLDLREVSRIRSLAEAKGVSVGVPFILRSSALADQLASRPELTPEGFQHLSFRFIVGPAARYERCGCAWMLDRRHAGGGALLNLGVHFIDLIATLTRSPITHVSAQTRTYRPDVTVEEQAVLTCRNAAGQIGVVEAGYLYPSTAEDQREFSFSIAHRSSYMRGYADQFFIKNHDQERGIASPIEYNTDAFYSVSLRRAWLDVASGRTPTAGLREAEHAVAVVEAAYRSAARGGASESVETPP